MDIEDRDILNQSKDDTEAFGALYEKYRGGVFRFFLYRVTFKKEVAEDLTQDTFIRAFARRERFQEMAASYLSYLLAIAHNILIDYYRSQGEETPLIEEIDTGDTSSGDMVGTFDLKIENEVLWKAVDRLSDQEKEIFFLRYHKDQPISVIAEKVHKRANAVKIILSRARKKLIEDPLLIAYHSFLKSK